jgi:hypothetical protein
MSERERPRVPSPGDRAREDLRSGLDLAFATRVCRTGAVAAVVLALLVAGWLGWGAALSFLAGAAVGIGSLASIHWMVRRLEELDGRSARRLGIAVLLKFPVLAAAVLLAVWTARGEPRAMAALLAGASLVPAVVVLKVAGLWLVGRTAAPAGSVETRRARQETHHG